MLLAIIPLRATLPHECVDVAAPELVLLQPKAPNREPLAKQNTTATSACRDRTHTHLPRERVVIPGPTACPCCNGRLVKLGETITETLEVIPRQWKVVQTVREKFSCRTCETITQPPAPFHPISRGRAGPELLAMILEAKFGQHLPLNRQSESYALEGIHLDVSTLGGWVGASTAALAPLLALIRQHVLAAERLHGDDTTVPVLAKSKTTTRPAVDLCPRRPAVRRPRAAGGGVFLLARSRRRASATATLASYAGILQADAYAGFNELYLPGRLPGAITEAACWAHGRRKFFVLADVAKAPIAIEAVRRIDLLFDVERDSNGLEPGQRHAARQERVVPLVAELQTWMRAERGPALPPQRRQPGDGLHAQALAGIRQVPRRRPDLPDQQRRGTRPARHRSRAEVLAVRRLRSRRHPRRRRLHADHHRQAEQRRPARLARRCPAPHRRPARSRPRRPLAVELVSAGRSGCRSRLTTQPWRSPDGYGEAADVWPRQA